MVVWFMFYVVPYGIADKPVELGICEMELLVSKRVSFAI